MAATPAKLRDEALKAMKAGRFETAAEHYRELVKTDRKEVSHCLRVAEAYSKAGNTQRTVFWYAVAAKRFAQSGHLPKAIATAKMVLELKPDHEEIKPMLAELYAKKDGDSQGADSIREHLVNAQGKPAVAPPSSAPSPSVADDVEELEILDLAAEAALEELPKVPLFSDLDPAAFTGLIDSIEVQPFEAGATIVCEGEKGDAFYILTAGKVSVQKENAAGMAIKLAVLEEGAFFGEFAYLAGTRRSASVIAEENAETLVISRQALDALSAEHPKVKKALHQFYRDRVLSNLLAISPLFEPLPPATKMQVLGQFRYQEFPANAVLIEEGVDGRELFVIVSGTATAIHTGGGKKEALGTLKEGDFFGEMSLLRGEKTTAQVRAETPLTCFSLQAGEFKQLIADYPQLRSVLQAHAEERRLLNASQLAEAGLI